MNRWLMMVWCDCIYSSQLYSVYFYITHTTHTFEFKGEMCEQKCSLYDERERGHFARKFCKQSKIYSDRLLAQLYVYVHKRCDSTHTHTHTTEKILTE